MSFKSWFGASEDPEGSWLGFGIFVLIWIWSLVSYTTMIRISAMYLDFEGAKKIHVLYVLIWGFGGSWSFLIGFWYHDQDMDITTGLWYTYIPNFGSLSCFWRCKEDPCPLSPQFGLWRTLEDPDWVSVSWSWFRYDRWSEIHLYSEFWLSI